MSPIFKVTDFEPTGDVSMKVRRALAIGFASGLTLEGMRREIINSFRVDSLHKKRR